MHPLMNRFHDDERRRLIELLGVKETIAPLVSRRVFLQSAGATGLVIGFGWLAPTDAEAALPGVEGAATGPLAPNAFVRVGTDNLVTVICKHHEMGQGNTTGLASLVADELDADWSLVRTEYAPSDAKLYNNLNFGPMQGTGGSSAIANSFLQYRGAGATARAMLVAAAAEAWHLPAAEIRTSKSTLIHASGRRATYGEMAVAASRQTPPENPPLKKAAQFTFIGKDRSTPRVDSPSKCNGTAIYTADLKLAGLLTAVIAWPPGFGAKLVSFDATDAKNVKGVTDVVQVPEGVAVVATGMWAALQGRRALKVQWDESASKWDERLHCRGRQRREGDRCPSAGAAAVQPRGRHRRGALSADVRSCGQGRGRCAGPHRILGAHHRRPVDHGRRTDGGHDDQGRHRPDVGRMRRQDYLRS